MRFGERATKIDDFLAQAMNFKHQVIDPPFIAVDQGLQAGVQGGLSSPARD